MNLDALKLEVCVLRVKPLRPALRGSSRPLFGSSSRSCRVDASGSIDTTELTLLLETPGYLTILGRRDRREAKSRLGPDGDGDDAFSFWVSLGLRVNPNPRVNVTRIPRVKG